jgi:hypothetical protein
MVIYSHFIFIGVKGKIIENGIKRRMTADSKSANLTNGYVSNRSLPKVNKTPPVDYVAVDLEEEKQNQNERYTEPSFEILLPRSKKAIETNPSETIKSKMNMIAEEEFYEITDREFETPSERSNAKTNKTVIVEKSILKVQKSSPKKSSNAAKSQKQFLVSFNAAPERKTIEPSINNTPYNFEVKSSQGIGTGKHVTLKTHKIPPSSINRKVTYLIL